MRDSLDFKRDPVGALFRKMFLPTLVSMVSMVVLNITDGAFVGHGAGSDALAAVNIVSPLFLLMGGIGLMFGIGSSVVASIHLAKGNVHAAKINLTQGLAAGTVLGLLITLVLLAFPETTVRLFGCSPALMPLACTYLRCIALMVPFSIFNHVVTFLMRLDGSPRFAMGINCLGAGLNMILDYILIFPMGLGLKGAGIATALSFSLCALPGLYYLAFRTRTVGLHPIKTTRTSLQLTARNLGYQMRIGASALLGELSIASVIIVGNFVFMKYLGEDGVAAYSVGCYCLPLVFMMGNAIVQSVQPIISFAHGVGDKDRMAQALRVAMRTAVVGGLLGTLLMWAGSGPVSSVFLPVGCPAHTLCSQGLPWFSTAFLFVVLNIVWVGYRQSIEKATGATLITLLRGFFLALPAFLLLPRLLGTPGLWLALPFAEGLTLTLIALHSLHSRLSSQG